MLKLTLTAALAAGAGHLNAAVRNATPATGIQAVVNAAQPGDTVSIAPGVYYESVSVTNGGLPGAPILIAAAKGGTVTISGAEPGWATKPPRFERVEGDLYRTAIEWPVRWLLADGRVQWPYPSLDSLKAFLHNGQWGPPEGFAWVDGMLYVRLRDGADPNKRKVEIHARRNGPNLVVEADDVRVEGLRLHMAGAGPALVCVGDRIALSDLHIIGAKHGIAKRGGADFSVEHCEFSGYPLYEWKRANFGFWATAYNFINFTTVQGPRMSVRHNVVHDVCDALSFSAATGDDGAEWSDVSYNLLARGLDDLLEFDSREVLNVRVHHNVLLDGMVAFALSPVMGGNLRIDHNLVYVSPEQGLPSTAIKLANPWIWKFQLPTQGVVLEHNTIVNMNKDDVYGSQLYWGGEHWFYRDTSFINNLAFFAAPTRPWLLADWTPSRHNMIAGPGVTAAHFPHFMTASDPGFASLDPLDIRLRADSPAAGNGVNRDAAGGTDPARGRTDLGAMPRDAAWTFPQPGPRWADAGHRAARPLPASFTAHWGGLSPAQQPDN